MNPVGAAGGTTFAGVDEALVQAEHVTARSMQMMIKQRRI